VIKILANENFPIASVKYLENEGFDIMYIGYEHAGITDKEVMDLAIADDRLIVTFDRDYGELIFKYEQKPPAGVIYLRIFDFSPDYPGEFLKNILNSENLIFREMFTVIDERGIRQKKY
jgi:predicted nuclease of predicted toxin-antitoxin system